MKGLWLWRAWIEGMMEVVFFVLDLDGDDGVGGSCLGWECSDLKGIS